MNELNQIEQILNALPGDTEPEAIVFVSRNIGADGFRTSKAALLRVYVTRHWVFFQTRRDDAIRMEAHMLTDVPLDRILIIHEGVEAIEDVTWRP